MARSSRRAQRQVTRSFPRDVFVLGAGFSRKVSTSMPLTRDLFSLCEIQMKKGKAKVLQDAEVMDGYSRLGRNFELWLTWLASDQPWMTEIIRLRNRAAFSEIAEALGNVILESQNVAVGKKFMPPWLADLIRAWSNRSTTVITLNYDAILEKAYSIASSYPASLLYSFRPQPMLGATPTGRGPNQRFQLYKLHGSITWYIYPFGDSGTSVYGPIYDPELKRDWGETDGPFEVSERAGARRPLIVPPLLTKDSYFVRPELRDQWLRAEAALRQAERLFILGYSFPDADQSMRFLLDRTHPRCEVTIIDIDPDVGKRGRRLLKPRPILTRTSGTAAIPDFVNTYVLRRNGQAF